MSIELLLALLSLAVVDSINPSALIATGFILTKTNRLKNVLAYVAGIFISYFVLGILIFAGANGLIHGMKELMSSQGALIIQAVIGGALLLYAIVAPDKLTPEKEAKREAFLQKILQPKLLFVYGMQVTVIELISALPYFAALSLLAQAQVTPLLGVASIAVYCLLFVLPPLVVAYLYARNSSRFKALLEKYSKKHQKGGRETLLWIVGIIGFVLLTQSLQKLL